MSSLSSCPSSRCMLLLQPCHLLLHAFLLLDLSAAWGVVGQTHLGGPDICCRRPPQFSSPIRTIGLTCGVPARVGEQDTDRGPDILRATLRKENFGGGEGAFSETVPGLERKDTWCAPCLAPTPKLRNIW